MKRHTLLLALAIPALSLACSSSDKDSDAEASAPIIDCAKATVPKYSELGFLQTTCAQCHSSTKTGAAARQAAPDDVNFDTYEAAKAAATRAVGELYEDPPAMPPADAKLTPVTDAERIQLNTWAQCETPQ